MQAEAEETLSTIISAPMPGELEEVGEPIETDADLAPEAPPAAPKAEEKAEAAPSPKEEPGAKPAQLTADDLEKRLQEMVRKERETVQRELQSKQPPVDPKLLSEYQQAKEALDQGDVLGYLTKMGWGATKEDAYNRISAQLLQTEPTAPPATVETRKLEQKVNERIAKLEQMLEQQQEMVRQSGEAAYKDQVRALIPEDSLLNVMLDNPVEDAWQRGLTIYNNEQVSLTPAQLVARLSEEMQTKAERLLKLRGSAEPKSDTSRKPEVRARTTTLNNDLAAETGEEVDPNDLDDAGREALALKILRAARERKRG